MYALTFIGLCLKHIVDLYQPLVNFSNEEINTLRPSSSGSLSIYKIPKKPLPTASQKSTLADKQSSTSQVLSRQERVFMFLTDDNKALCHFLLHVIPVLESMFQCSQKDLDPHIKKYAFLAVERFAYQNSKAISHEVNSFA
ncbi:hypothetical protein PR048_012875 [Dryococelus australis]|uniref:Huntingtin n=1 Tax=Dryococelus australis TaxID=614101 RepID=A0ABQ9HQK4_9NEOP|nr:hypothetical protein PR048_012875 [Dryococelus australis]